MHRFHKKRGIDRKRFIAKVQAGSLLEPVLGSVLLEKSPS